MQAGHQSHARAWVPMEVGELWSYLSDDSHLPEFVGHLAATERLGDQTSRWYLKSADLAPVSVQVVLLTSPARELAWRSLPGRGSLEAEGWLRLEPEGQGTRVSLFYQYRPLGGAAREVCARLFHNAATQAEHDLAALAERLGRRGQPEDEDADPVGPPPGKTSATPNPLESELVRKDRG